MSYFLSSEMISFKDAATPARPCKFDGTIILVDCPFAITPRASYAFNVNTPSST